MEGICLQNLEAGAVGRTNNGPRGGAAVELHAIQETSGDHVVPERQARSSSLEQRAENGGASAASRSRSV